MGMKTMGKKRKYINRKGDEEGKRKGGNGDDMRRLEADTGGKLDIGRKIAKCCLFNSEEISRLIVSSDESGDSVAIFFPCESELHCLFRF